MKMLIKRLLLIAILLLFVTALSAQEEDKTLPGENDPLEEETESETSSILDDEDFIQEMLEQGDVEITLEDLVLEVEFDDDDDWEFYEEDTRFVMVDDDVYIAEVEDNATIWGQNTDDFDDGVLSIVVLHDAGSEDSGFGIMCRANEDNNLEGYHFWISGDGEAAIQIYDEDEDGYDTLEGWEEIDAINIGEENILHVVCVDDYLALYVNGELALETRDDTFDDGVTGLSVGNFEDDEFSRVLFDDLHIWEASD